jgi:phosphatidylglycerol:prolipoprotein diacylglycerol transferase
MPAATGVAAVELIQLGPLALRPTGLLTAAGALLAFLVIRRVARDDALDLAPLPGLAAAALAGGLVGAHLVHLLVYHPEEYDGPLALLRLGDGLSSIGGLAGGTLAVLLAWRGRRPPLGAYGDALALGLAPGWAVGRLGCALVHDHPGLRLGGPLSFASSDGPRLDLGLAEALVLLLLSAVLLGLRRAGRARGRLLPVLAAAYGAARLLLDGLRATDLPGADARVAGLTPAQWGGLLLLAWGVRCASRPPVTR